MYRQQLHVKVVLGKYREFYDVITNLNEELKRKDLTQVQMWSPATGDEMNTVILVSDFNSLADWESANHKFLTDPEVMKIWRESVSYVDGRPREELLQSVYEIA
ncbi:MAG TPA: NIPSNAP family protein [Acidimicrobiales bacterium]|nr:NIPSNAP family protein [Acidimicrobiales bacterium]